MYICKRLFQGVHPDVKPMEVKPEDVKPMEGCRCPLSARRKRNPALQRWTTIAYVDPHDAEDMDYRSSIQSEGRRRQRRLQK